jgi:hypothetical protein
MAKAKTKRNSKKNAPSKRSSRFYVVNTVQETRQNLVKVMGEYNKKLIDEPLKSGKTLARNLKKQPFKTVSALFVDGNEYIADLNKETLTKVNAFVKESRSLLVKTGKNPRKTLSGMIDDGMLRVEDLQNDLRDKMTEAVDDYKSVINGIGQDSRLILEAAVDGGKKAFDKVPGKQKLEKAISIRVQDLPALLNLPSQKEINRILRRLKNLDSKVEALSKAQTAAA